MQKLKERQALEGLSTEPSLLIEIEDISAEIAQLQAELGQSESGSENIDLSVLTSQRIPLKKAVPKSTVRLPGWSIIIIGGLVVAAGLSWSGWMILFRGAAPATPIRVASVTPSDTLTPNSASLASGETQSAQASPDTPTPVFTPVPPTSTLQPSCVDQYLADIGADKQIGLEEGVRSADFFVPTQELANNSQLGPLGIRLTQNGQSIAALKYIFFPEDTLFKITSVLGADCQEVEAYSNATRSAAVRLKIGMCLRFSFPRVCMASDLVGKGIAFGSVSGKSHEVKACRFSFGWPACLFGFLRVKVLFESSGLLFRCRYRCKVRRAG